MKFDPRKARSNYKPRKDEWDLRSFKVRKSFFSGAKDIQITKKVLDIFGEELVRGVRYEASKAASRTSMIPNSKEFLDSFSYEISKGGAIKIRSTWPWVKTYLEKRSPYPMSWLTRASGSKKVIALRDRKGDVIFRNAPLRLKDAWVHPATAKFNFLTKGIERGRRNAILRVKGLYNRGEFGKR